jgi:ribosomal protein L33
MTLLYYNCEKNKRNAKPKSKIKIKKFDKRIWRLQDA